MRDFGWTSGIKERIEGGSGEGEGMQAMIVVDMCDTYTYMYLATHILNFK